MEENLVTVKALRGKSKRCGVVAVLLFHVCFAVNMSTILGFSLNAGSIRSRRRYAFSHSSPIATTSSESKSQLFYWNGPGSMYQNSTTGSPWGNTVLNYKHAADFDVRVHSPSSLFHDDNKKTAKRASNNIRESSSGRSTKSRSTTTSTTTTTPVTTLYETLGVSNDVDHVDIKKAYIRLAKQTHPDAALGAEEASSKHTFMEIAEAYKVLSDPKLRQQYDRDLKAAKITEDFDLFLTEKVGPSLNAFMTNIAVPFIDKTTTAAVSFFDLDFEQQHQHGQQVKQPQEEELKQNKNHHHGQQGEPLQLEKVQMRQEQQPELSKHQEKVTQQQLQPKKQEHVKQEQQQDKQKHKLNYETDYKSNIDAATATTTTQPRSLIDIKAPEPTLTKYERIKGRPLKKAMVIPRNQEATVKQMHKIESSSASPNTKSTKSVKETSRIMASRAPTNDNSNPPSTLKEYNEKESVNLLKRSEDMYEEALGTLDSAKRIRAQLNDATSKKMDFVNLYANYAASDPTQITSSDVLTILDHVRNNNDEEDHHVGHDDGNHHINIADVNDEENACAVEYTKVLYASNDNNQLSVVDRVRLWKKYSSIYKTVKDLQDLEGTVSKQRTEIDASHQYMVDQRRKYQSAKVEYNDAITEEQILREKLIQAQKRVSKTKLNLSDVTNTLSNAERQTNLLHYQQSHSCERLMKKQKKANSSLQTIVNINNKKQMEENQLEEQLLKEMSEQHLDLQHYEEQQQQQQKIRSIKNDKDKDNCTPKDYHKRKCTREELNQLRETETSLSKEYNDLLQDAKRIMSRAQNLKKLAAKMSGRVKNEKAMQMI